MKLSLLLGALSIALAGVVSAQTYNEAAQVETRTVTISGDVVRYEPGQVIVIRGSDNKEVSYTLSPSIAVPGDLQAGQKVTLYSERSADGSRTAVSRIVTTTVTPEGRLKATTDETRRTASGDVTTTRTTTISGEVVKYEPGRTIVVREPSRKVVTYTLAPDVSVPADIEAGKNVTLYTEPSAEGGTTMVKRVTTTTVTPAGNTKSTTEETRTEPSGATSTTTRTTISGKVESYESGKTLTIVRPDGSRATYAINDKSNLPADLVIGKTVTLAPSNSDAHVVETVTIREP